MKRLALCLILLTLCACAQAAAPYTRFTSLADLRAEPQATPDMTLKVNSGQVYVNGTWVTYAGGNSSAFSAPGATNRIDLLTLDSTGTLAITQGVAAGSPSAPAIPAAKLAICTVYLKSTSTSIISYNDGAAAHGYILADLRPFITSPEDLSGYVTTVTGTAPIVSSGGTTPAISITDPDATHKGAVPLTGAPATNVFLRGAQTSGAVSWAQVAWGDLSGVPGTFTPSAHDILSAYHGDALAASVFKGDVMVGNATPKWSRLAVGTDGYTLTAQADGTVAWEAIPAGGAAHNILSASHGDSTAASAVRGDIITGQGASPLWTRLAFPASPTGKLLQATATDVGWSTYALTMEAASILGQDYSTDAGPTFDHLHLTTALGAAASYVPAGFLTTLNLNATSTVAGGTAGTATITGSTNAAWIQSLVDGTTGGEYANGLLVNIRYTTDGLRDILNLQSGSVERFVVEGDGTSTLTGAGNNRYVLSLVDGTAGGAYSDGLFVNIRYTGSVRTILDLQSNSISRFKLTGDGALTFPGTMTLTSATVDAGGATSREVPNGASPTVDAEGEVAWETDDDTLHVYDGAADVVIAGKTKIRSFTILSPTSAHDCPIWQVPADYSITIVGIRALAIGGTNVIGCLDEYGTDGTTLTAAVDSDWTITTSEFNDTSYSNAGIAAGAWLRWRTTSVSGSVTSVNVNFEYYQQ